VRSMKGLQSLAVLGLALAAMAPSHAQIKSTDFTVPEVSQGIFNVAQAYPCTVNGYTAGMGISNAQTWGGSCGVEPLTGGAAPGILSLRRNGQFRLDANCFAVVPAGQKAPCYIQSFNLTKEVPGSFKCPDVYGQPHFDDKGNLIPYRYFQFGTGVRTWWSLNFTQPGTRFVLQVVSVCFTITTSQPRVHKDVWIWRVVANADTLLQVIELMHGGALSILEVPCILGEDMYVALKTAAQRVKTAQASGNLNEIGNAIFDMEALIVANCLFIEVLRPTLAFPGSPQFGEPGIQPPGNLAQTVNFGGQGTAVAGIIDTIENPCCCKLLVDLEWIAIRNGLIGQLPTLPTF
jgi:hypothetical protein